jgi:hypothetical protein
VNPVEHSRHELTWLLGAVSLMTIAVLRWPHRRGGTAHCLARVRLLDGAGGDEPLQRGSAVVILSELRDNPRGLSITADVPGAVLAARHALLPAACSPEAVTWLLHHGPFTTYDIVDPADTLTRIVPRGDGAGYTDDVHDHELLTPEQTAMVMRSLGLGPVEHELRSWPVSTGPVPAPGFGAE